MPYKLLRDYGVIGDMRSAALVGRDGSIDWCCFPRFDSPSVFAALLDDARGGLWSVAPAAPARSAQRYTDQTNVLVTTFETETGRLELVDFMPVRADDPAAPERHEIHRRVDAIGGDVEVVVRFQPRFDYSRQGTRFRIRRHGILATDADRDTLTLACSQPLEWTIDDEGGEAVARFTARVGSRTWFVLRFDDDEVWPVDNYASDAKLAATRGYWMEWCADLEYEGDYRPMVERSALVLKLLFYAPTGAIVAAPTTSLPEVLGGSRNWDYRFTWLRDATFTLFGLYALRKFGELDAYMHFLKKVCRRESEHLQVLYGVGGEPRVPEEEMLSHLEGYRGSRPVRIGNAAPEQIQLDVYGEVLDAVHIWRRRFPMTEGIWDLCRSLANRVAENWTRPDNGVWEVRHEPRHFVFSKVMCWVALDRAIRAADELGLDGPVARWREVRDEIREQILRRGWSEERRAFTQHYDTDRMDAANLTLPMVRFLPPDDPRVLSTIEATVKELAHPGTGLLYRYRNRDGLPGNEGVFCLNTFQLAQAYAMCGQHAKAVETFESVLRYASPLGLLAEEIEPETGELLGNYPQGFSHIGLINAAHVISRTKPREPATGALLPE